MNGGGPDLNDAVGCCVGGAMAKIDVLKSDFEQMLVESFHKELLNAAFSNLADTSNCLRFNNFAYALRELLRIVFEYNSPDKEVLSCPWYKNETDKKDQVTRKQRILYMLYGGVSKEVFSDALLEEIEESTKLIIEKINFLSKFTHIGEATFGIDASDVDSHSEEVMESVLDVFNLIGACRREIRDYLHDSIYDAVLATLSENVYDALDDKSTHTCVDEVTLESFEIVAIDKDYILLEGEGSVGCELQYGSGSDIAKDFGAVGSCSFPFTFTGKVSASNLDDIDISSRDIDIDDSSWYE